MYGFAVLTDGGGGATDKELMKGDIVSGEIATG